jgi:soluble lytic murein transglycosylase
VERIALTCIKTGVASLCAAIIFASPWPSFAQGGDADVLAAREAAQRGQWKVVEGYRSRLAGHTLEAYPWYWMLQGSVDRVDPREVRAFLDRYPGTPLAEGLRREWLRALGASASWEVFRAEYPKVVGDDAEITCYSFQERLARSDPEVMAEARSLFVSHRESGVACDNVFAALASSGRITETETWERLRAMLADGNVKEARRAAALLPPKSAINEKQLERVAKDPGAFLAKEKPGKAVPRAEQELLVFAVERLARSKPDEAAERLMALTPRLEPQAVRHAWGQVAWQGALNHHPRALEWYSQVGTTALTDTQIAWRARASLRAGDWKEVLASIQALSPEQQREPTWRYWRARALRQLGEAPAGELLLRGIAGQQTFYGILAAEELGIAAAPEWNGFRPQPTDLDRVRAIEGIQRALALYRIGLDPEALREWMWAIRGLDDRGLLAAAELARQANEIERAINTADRTVQLHDLSQRFPTPHRDTLSAAARQWDLDEAYVYGLIRQESRFMADARSRVGAAGLMQLMPATARWVARQMAIKPYKPDMLLQPDTNLQMGTYYYSRVLSDLGHPLLATAAYNAGPGRARRWRDERPLEGAIYAETIPFNETRDYVKKVFTNAWYYHHRLTGRTANLHEMLGQVRGRAGDSSVASNIP